MRPAGLSAGGPFSIRPSSFDDEESAKADTSQPVVTVAPATPPTDERLKDTSLLTRLMRRPELGAAAGLVLVTLFFLTTADSSMFTLAGVMNILAPASQLGILAVAAALLMIGGEFDLSIGSMVAFTGLIFGALLTISGLPLLVAIALTLVLAGLLGAINGQIVIRTRLP